MRVIVAMLLFSVFAAPVRAQVVARQGHDTANGKEVQRFASPMILDVPFPATDPSTWTGFNVRPEPLASFVCNGVSFRDFAVQVKRVRGKKLLVTYYNILANEPGIDKLAKLEFQLLRAGEVLRYSQIPWFQVEEGRISVRSGEMIVPEEVVTSTPALQLRIAVSVRDDS